MPEPTPGIESTETQGGIVPDPEKKDDTHPHKSAAEPPGDSQVTNPNRVIGDGDEIADDHD